MPPKNALADHAGRAHDAPPDPLVGWGGGTLPIPHPTRRLDSRAFGARYSLPRRSKFVPPPQCKNPGYTPAML